MQASTSLNVAMPWVIFPSAARYTTSISSQACVKAEQGHTRPNVAFGTHRLSLVWSPEPYFVLETATGTRSIGEFKTTYTVRRQKPSKTDKCAGVRDVDNKAKTPPAALMGMMLYLNLV